MTKKGLDRILEDDDEVEIRHTEKGEPYYISKNSKLEEEENLASIEEIKKEFVRERLSFFTFPAELGRK